MDPDVVRLVDTLKDAKVTEAEAAKAACSMLMIAAIYQNKLDLASAGAIPHLVGWLQKGPLSEAAACALPVLQSMARGCAPNQIEIASAGAIPLVVKILRWELLEWQASVDTLQSTLAWSSLASPVSTGLRQCCTSERIP